MALTLIGAQPAAAAESLQQALDAGAASARQEFGASTYATVIDRRSGDVLARTDNAGVQVASESVAKVLLAAYYLIRYHGNLPADIEPNLRQMVELSDDDLATAYWNTDAVPTVVQRYGLTGIEAAVPDPGYWGGTQITADGMAKFLYEVSEDREVGPWLVAAMRDSTDTATDGFDQNFGFNTLDGVASKQGWGSDNWTAEYNAVHSIGLTDYYAAAVLTTGPSGTYYSLGAAVTQTVELIVDADRPAPPAAADLSGSAPEHPATQDSATADPATADPAAPDRPADDRDNWWRRALTF